MEENPYASPDAQVDRPDLEAGGGELAGRGRRLGGAVLDNLIGAVLSIPLLFYTGFVPRMLSGQTLTPAETALFALYGWVVFLLINGYWLHTAGQTVGKKLVGTRIVGMDGSNPGLPKLFLLRYLPVGLVAYIPVVGVLAGFVDALLIFKSDRRCGHDHIAGTKVIMA